VKVFVPVHVLFEARTFVVKLSTYPFGHSSVEDVGVSVEVGRYVLNVFVFVHAFDDERRFEGTLSTYPLGQSWVDVVGVRVEVGR